MQDANSNATCGKRFLRRSDAAVYITDRYGFPCSRQWLANLAVIGGGPEFRKAGRYPIYAPGDLDRWAQARIGPAQCSTSDDGSQKRRAQSAGQSSVARQSRPEAEAEGLPKLAAVGIIPARAKGGRRSKKRGLSEQIPTPHDEIEGVGR